MNIVNFTPITATLGGMIIGLAVVIFFSFNGRLVGISGIASNALTEKDNKFDNLLFLLGLIIGGRCFWLPKAIHIVGLRGNLVFQSHKCFRFATLEVSILICGWQESKFGKLGFQGRN